jgi:hypothetical protein
MQQPPSPPKKNNSLMIYDALFQTTEVSFASHWLLQKIKKKRYLRFLGFPLSVFFLDDPYSFAMVSEKGRHHMELS